ncbi:MAG: 3'-5' exonuclease [Microscillaceae bacterium]|nr:3'-5' exonuclease [Microscillaceae bacterium]
MFSNQEIGKILFLDIETVRGVKSYSELSEGMQAMWENKAQYIQIAELPDAEAKYYERAGIFAEFGRVVCISFGFVYWQQDQPMMRIKSFFGANEKEILTQLRELLDNKFAGWRLCAHNGKEFDFPYLCRRFLINQIPIPKVLQIQGKKPWEVAHLDTMELWKFGDYKNYTKLELLCHIFGVPTPKDEMDGSMVSTVFWDENNAAKIARYCEKDVIATIQVFLKYCLQDLIPESHIQISE